MFQFFQKVLATTSVALVMAISLPAQAQRPVEPLPLGLNPRSDSEMLRGFWQVRGMRNVLLNVVVRDDADPSSWTATIYTFDRKNTRWVATPARSVSWEDGNLNLGFRESQLVPALVKVSAFREVRPAGTEDRFVFKATFMGTTGKILKILTVNELYRY